MAGYILPDEDVEALHEAGIDLDVFRPDSQRILYEVIFNWTREASNSLTALSEANSCLMDATVYGSYRSIRSAVDAVGKNLSASLEILLAVIGQLDSPVQIKAALDERESGSKKLSPIAEALSQLDGHSRENLRVAFLTLLNTARTIQNPIEVATATKDTGENVSSTPGPASSSPGADETPIKKIVGNRSKRLKRQHRRLRNKTSS